MLARDSSFADEDKVYFFIEGLPSRERGHTRYTLP